MEEKSCAEAPLLGRELNIVNGGQCDTKCQNQSPHAFFSQFDETQIMSKPKDSTYT